MRELSIDHLRRETPGVAFVTHFNNAGASLMPCTVVDAIKAHLDLEARIGGYEAATQEASKFDAVYTSIARLIGAEVDEIALTDSATRSWSSVFYAIGFGPGDEIVTSESEYVSNYLALIQVANRTGAKIVVVSSDNAGTISLAALERAIGPKTKLISLTHVPTNSGLVQPAAAVGRIARQAGVPFLLDATQSIGQLPLDVPLSLLRCTDRHWA